jgi:urease accessory protein
MKIIRRLTAIAGILTLCLPSAASAHTGLGETIGFMHGFSHPVGGIDHILAMIAVGLYAAQLGGRALWLVPLTFVAMMAAGGAAGIHGMDLVWVEIGIAASVVVLGLAVAFGLSLPALAAAGLAGFFAIFHGHAHGVEMPAGASALTYAAGFMLATALLHAGGIAFGFGLDRLARSMNALTARVSGGAMALAGIGLITGVL